VDFETDLDAKGLLAEVDKALQAVMAGGQEYVIGNRRLRRADLADLLAARKQLKANIDAEEAVLGGAFGGLFPVFFGPR
jgi:hypothetical protein